MKADSVAIVDRNGDFHPGRLLAWFLVLAAAAVSIGWGVREYSAHTAGTKGTLSIQAQRGSADNRTHWSGVFSQLYNNIRADQANIKVSARFASSKNATQQDAVNLEGVQQNCDQDVADWNADLTNALAVVPTQYPQTRLDPDTVCSTDPDTTGFINP